MHFIQILDYLLLNAIANGGGSIFTAGAGSETNIIAVSDSRSICTTITAAAAAATAGAAACIQQFLLDVGQRYEVYVFQIH